MGDSKPGGDNYSDHIWPAGNPEHILCDHLHQPSSSLFSQSRLPAWSQVLVLSEAAVVRTDSEGKLHQCTLEAWKREVVWLVCGAGPGHRRGMGCPVSYHFSSKDNTVFQPMWTLHPAETNRACAVTSSTFALYTGLLSLVEICRSQVRTEQNSRGTAHVFTCASGRWMCSSC